FVLSVHHQGDLVIAALEAGASGYAHRSINTAWLLDAMADVAHGLRSLCPVAQAAIDRSQDPDAIVHAALTSRERQVVELIMHDKSNQEIAGALGLHVGTVEAHRRNIFHKLSVHTAVGLMRH